MKTAGNSSQWIRRSPHRKSFLASTVEGNTSRSLATLNSAAAASRSSTSASTSAHHGHQSQRIPSGLSPFCQSSRRGRQHPQRSISTTPATPPLSSLTFLATDLGSLFNPNHAWNTRLFESARNLSKGNSRPLRISVVGSTHSQSSHLLDALLDEPFTYASKADTTQREQASADSATAISLIQERRQIAAALESKVRSDPESGYGSSSDLTQGLKIQYAPSAHLGFPSSSDASQLSMPVLGLPLPWLQEGTGIEIIELLDPGRSPSESLLSTLYTSDLILFHTTLPGLLSSIRADPVLSLLSRFAEKPGTRLLVDDSNGDSSAIDLDSVLESLIGPASLGEIRSQIRSTSTNNSAPTQAASLISTRLALRANASLRTALNIDTDYSSTSSAISAAWESFRSEHVASNFPSVRALISPSTLPSPAASASHSLTLVIRHALSSAASQISSARQEINHAKGASGALSEAAESEMASKELEVLQGARKWAARSAVTFAAKSREAEPSRWRLPGLDLLLGKSRDVEVRAGDLPSSSMSVGETVESESESAPLAASAGVISTTLGNRLAWWKVAGLGRVDDVRTEVEGAVVAGWGRGAEEWLIFEAGRILSAAQTQSHKTNLILKSISKNTRSSSSLRNLSTPTSDSGLPTSVFSSSLLRNSVDAHSPSRLQMFSSPLLLSSPIARRRSQLLSPGGPLDALVRGGQKAVFQSWLIGGSGVGLSLLGLGIGAGLRLGLLEHFPGVSLSSIAMEPSTSLALALLSVFLAAWRMQGQWAKEKKRFWRRWEKVANGLEEDVKAQLRRVLRQGVYITPVVASGGIDQLIRQREERIRLMEKEMGKAIKAAREIGVLESNAESKPV